MKTREDFYFKIIIPSVTYGLMIWGSCGKTLMDEIEKVHVRAAKIIYGLDWCTPSEQVLATAKWNTIKNINSRRLLCLAYNCYYAHVPELLQSLISKKHYAYNFRRKLTLALPTPKSNFVRNSILFRATILWNSLTNDQRASMNIACFKTILKTVKF